MPHWKFKGSKLTSDQQQKLREAVHWFILAIAIICLIIAFTLREAESGTPAFVRDLTLDFGSGLFAVFVLYIIVRKYFGLDDEENIIKRINTVLQTIQNRYGSLLDSQTVRQRFPIDQHFTSAKTIDLLGYDLSSFIGEYHELLLRLVEEGAQIRILVVSPKGLARLVMHKNAPNLTIHWDKIRQTLGHVKYIQDKIGKGQVSGEGKFEFKVTDWIPSSSLFVLDRDRPTGRVQVAVNTPDFRTTKIDRIHFILDRQTDPEWFGFYAEQFEGLWTHSEEWDGSYPPATDSLPSIELISKCLDSSSEMTNDTKTQKRKRTMRT